MPPANPHPSRVPGLPWAAGLAGIACVVVGTFLPWVNSGSVSRNLYTVTAVAHRMGLLGSWAWLSDWLPLVGPLLVVPVVLTAVGLRRSGAAAGLALAIVAGGAAGVVLALAAGRSIAGISLAAAGPVCVIVGAVALVAGAVGQLRPVGTRRPGAHPTGLAVWANDPAARPGWSRLRDGPREPPRTSRRRSDVDADARYRRGRCPGGAGVAGEQERHRPSTTGAGENCHATQQYSSCADDARRGESTP